MSDYPEHDKLRKVSDESQAIGLFLDLGLSEQGLILYERFEEPCDCHTCRIGETEKAVGIHCEADDVREGTAYYIQYRPTQRNISEILATYFGIDQEKIDGEKAQMLTQLRKQS